MRLANALVVMPLSASFVAYTPISAEVRSMRTSTSFAGIAESVHRSRWMPGCGSLWLVIVGAAMAELAIPTTTTSGRNTRESVSHSGTGTYDFALGCARGNHGEDQGQ